MQLVALLAALVAVNIGIVYVGSEVYEQANSEESTGIVEVEEVPAAAATTEAMPEVPENTQPAATE
jgi:hypothetical protein